MGTAADVAGAAVLAGLAVGGLLVVPRHRALPALRRRATARLGAPTEQPLGSGSGHGAAGGGGVGAGAAGGGGVGAGGVGPRRFGPACWLLATAVVLLLGPGWGAVPAGAVALAGPRLLARLDDGAAADEDQLLDQLPIALDLMAACLAGGADVPAATRAVAEAVGGGWGVRLARVAAELALGAAPVQAWSALAGSPAPSTAAPMAAPWGPRRSDPRRGVAASVARELGRAMDRGGPVTATLTRVADELRAEQRSRAVGKARRAGVLAVAPLGVCFLPAFVLLAVVPVVVGLLAPLLRAA